ncbi:MAG: ComEC/Rec2 family competence protein [Clostridia bacterium]|nr:ComEC/Rec2 family competence protein [Clostridia bacterium]
MKRIINFRPIAFAAVGAIVGAVISSYYPALGFFAFIIVGVLGLIYPIIVKLLCFDTPFSKIILSDLLFFFVILLSFLRVYDYVDGALRSAVKEGEYTVEGVVVEKSISGKEARVRLSDCVCNGENTGDIYFYSLSGVSLYDTVSVRCNLKPIDPTDDEGFRYSYLALKGVSYISFGKASAYITGKSQDPFAKIKLFVDSVFAVEEEENGGVITALFTGDTEYFDAETLNAYRFGGIAHVFAVSGMHVGMLYVALGFILRRKKGKRMIKCAIISIALIAYSGVCGFSASSMRAAITFTALCFSEALGEKGDHLTALSLACIIVCFLFPSEIFGIGFALSFLISLALILLAPPLKREMAFGEKISDVLSGTLSAQIAALPISVNSFGFFPIVGILTNILLVPIVSIVYYMLWVAFIISAIIPVIRPIALFLPNILITGIDGITTFLSSFKLSVDIMPPALAFAYYGGAIVYSDGVNASKAAKRAAFASIPLCFAVCAVFSAIM